MLHCDSGQSIYYLYVCRICVIHCHWSPHRFIVRNSLMWHRWKWKEFRAFSNGRFPLNANTNLLLTKFEIWFCVFTSVHSFDSMRFRGNLEACLARNCADRWPIRGILNIHFLSQFGKCCVNLSIFSFFYYFFHFIHLRCPCSLAQMHTVCWSWCIVYYGNFHRNRCAVRGAGIVCDFSW